MKIKKIQAIEILDSRGNPTIRTFVTLDDQTVASTSIPSGASTGSHEAVELRDNDQKRFFGKGVLKAVENVNQIIKNALIDQTADPKSIDETLIKLDATDNKAKLGANAILSVSQALIKAVALSQKKPLWQFINEYYFQEIKPSMPKIMFNVVNGGRHANWNFDIQEFIIIPNRQTTTESVRVGSEIYQSIKKNLKEKKLSTLIGDEGGFSPELKNNEEVFRLILDSAKTVGYINGKDFFLAIDAAASEFYLSAEASAKADKNKKYFFRKENRFLDGDELINYYLDLKNKYQIVSFEDPFAESDWENWSKFYAKVTGVEEEGLPTARSGGELIDRALTGGNPRQAPSLLIGDDLFCTNVYRMKIGFDKKSVNAVLIKPNQIGTIYQTIEAIKLAKKYNWKITISHRSGETEDSFIADLAYACSADFLKDGAPARGERLVKYNRLIEIENGL